MSDMKAIPLEQFRLRLKNYKVFYPKLTSEMQELVMRHLVIIKHLPEPTYKSLWCLGSPIHEYVIIHDPDDNTCVQCMKYEYEYMDYFIGGLDYWCPMCGHRKGEPINE